MRQKSPNFTPHTVFYVSCKICFSQIRGFVISPTIYRAYSNFTDKLSGHILRSKISIKLLIHMGSKALSLRDNQQKRKNNYDLNSLDFMGLSVH
jgi:hypothetical protein